ncbi:MAG: hypothetical protein HY287_03950 [Planctomycetes bacterium]|nr:hypothetical protein [Planctomycetota bacterium]MBI3833466.1 hypothetical protein [Planctomycetota bacterium]
MRERQAKSSVYGDGRLPVGLEKPAAGDPDGQWKDYKRCKIEALAARGYQVHCHSATNHWLQLGAPRIAWSNDPWIRADVKFYFVHSEHGVSGGRISKLRIETLEDRGVGGFAPGETLFDFERGLHLDRLIENSRAKKLYDDIIEELN